MNMYRPLGHELGIRNDVSSEAWSNPSESAKALLVALKLPKIGPVATRRFAATFGAGKAVPSGPEHYREAGILRRDDDYKLASDRVEKIVEVCTEKRISIISILDAQYPKRLRAISDAPPILYVVGNVSALSPDGCAVVGTRHASEYGKRIAFKVSAALSDRHFSVVSGLALGIDTSAHEGALDANGVTVAVMAHGLDTVAPSSNRKLAERICAKGGALISEHEPGVPPRPAEFVRRNRLQSGMSLCSVVVESGEQGGSMHQARFTRDQNKVVLAILPENDFGPLEGFNHQGGDRLVNDFGARRIRNISELLSEIGRICDLPSTGRTLPENERLL